ncbi:MAG: HDOD domain-containing protein [candidate division Zixibacteria bacterium]|nr:HDOD domain-containing protein [candidate division Zixibacteria bacterium]
MEQQSTRTAVLEKLTHFIRSGSLPSVPQVMFKIREVTDDPRSGVSDLADVILTDHQLTTRILRMANSAFYGEYAGKVTRVTQAVSLMGFRSVRNASMALAIYSAVERLGKCKRFDFGVFWSSSIGTGVIAKQLAQNLGLKLTEEAFIAGFLHDIGQPFLATVFPGEYDEILAQASEPSAIMALESEKLGVNHLEAGGMLARAWGLPETLVRPIENHHSSMVTKGASTSVRLSEIVSFADRLYPVVMTASEENSEDTAERLFGEHAEKFGVKPEFVAGLIEDGRALIVETAAELNANIIAKEVEVSVLSGYVSESHSELTRAKSELTELRRKFDEMKTGRNRDILNNNGTQNTRLFIPLNEVPDLGLKYIRRYREVSLQQKILEFLLPQYEQAKIQEAKDTPTVQVLDKAVTPVKRKKPKRTIMVLLAGLLSMVFSVTGVFFVEYIRHLEANQQEDYRKVENILQSLRSDVRKLLRRKD